MQGEEVAFERITQVYREEGKRRTLVPLEPNFWERVRAYLQRLEADLVAEATSNPSSPKATLLRDELRKAGKARDQIYTYRERKIAGMASVAAAGGGFELKPMTRLEQDLFHRIVAQLKAGRGEALEGKAPSPSPPIETTVAEAAPAAALATSTSIARAAQREFTILEITEDIPPFAGPSGTYRLRRGDLVSLPGTIAKVLTARGKAREIRFTIGGTSGA